jgi:hypothetical protein
MTTMHGRLISCLEKYPSSTHDELLKIIKSPDCEIFDFGELPLERSDEKGTFTLPLTKEEEDFWFEGLIPLPSKICFYQFKISGYESAITIRQDDDMKVWCQRTEGRNEHLGPNGFFVDGVWSRWMGKPDAVELESYNKNVLSMIQKLDEHTRVQLWGMNPKLAAYLTLMINSKSTEVATVQPTRVQQMLRRQLDRPQLRTYRRVTIISRKHMARAIAEAAAEHRASPCLHWRRSHLRIIHAGTPQEKKIVIPRFLVGKREEGMRREYIVKNVTPP